MRARTTWLSDAEKNLVYDEALVLLERVGLRMADRSVWHSCAMRGPPSMSSRGSSASRRSSSTGCDASARERS